MTNNEKKFWDILTNLFVGAEVKGKSGFINLMQAKQTYFKKVSVELHKEIDQTCGKNNDFKDEMYDKLYSFFHRYFSESGSIFYNYTPFFYKTYTKAYNDQPINEIQSFSNDYEQIITDRQDTSLFYKTQMLYYVKSDRIFRDLEIEIDSNKFIFDVSNMEGKKANEKKVLVYEMVDQSETSLSFSVVYSEKGRKTKIDDMLKVLKKVKIDISEDQINKAFKVFEKQSNVDYFINKDAKKFLSEQLDLWVYQYMFTQEADFSHERFNQIQEFKRISFKLINFIAQFENELVKVWNKPRFALNSNIVVTLDRLEAKGFDCERLKTHTGYKAQQEEWEELGLSVADGLVNNSYIPVDTKHFPDLKEEIEALFDEEDFDGLLIKSENYQALNTILPRFRDKIDLVYIDPPFNTGDDFDYLDRFQDSTWLSLMENRLEIAKDMLSKQGSFWLHLDYNADYMGKELLKNTFGKENFRSSIVWKHTRAKSTGSKNYGVEHNLIYYFSKSENYTWNMPFKDYEDDKFDRYYCNFEQNDGSYIRYSKKEMQDFRKNNQYPNGRIFSLIPIINMNKDRKNLKFEFKGIVETWATSKEELEKLDQANLIIQEKEGAMPLKKQYFDEMEGVKVGTLWDDIYPINSQASERLGFETQKPEKLLERIMKSSSKNSGIILDYHSGSGTTISAAHKLKRKWIGIEMGEHFYTVILPRMKKVLAGVKSGISKETNFQGGGLFKYYELEQYEQILRTTQYGDVPESWIDNVGDGLSTDCFLFDGRLSEAVISEGDEFSVDLSRLYEGIDLKETLHNVYGKRVKAIDKTSVTFDDDKCYPLLQFLKPLLVW